MARRITAGKAGGESIAGIQAISPTTLTAKDDLDIAINPEGTGRLLIGAHAVIQDQSSLRFEEDTTNGSNYVAFQAPASVSANVTWTLPGADGSSDQVLSTNGTGTLSWSTPGVAVSNNTSDSATNYILFHTGTTGSTSTVRTSSTGLTFQPSTGLLTVAAISGYAAAVTLTADNTTNATNYPLFSSAATGNVSPRTDTGFTYNPSSGELTAVILTASSDIATKEEIETITDALDKVKSLRGVSYIRRENKMAEIGVLAQEVERVVPSIVRGAEGNKSVAYGNLVALLIEAIKEQQDQIDELKGRFA